MVWKSRCKAHIIETGKWNHPRLPVFTKKTGGFNILDMIYEGVTSRRYQNVSNFLLRICMRGAWRPAVPNKSYRRERPGNKNRLSSCRTSLYCNLFRGVAGCYAFSCFHDNVSLRDFPAIRHIKGKHFSALPDPLFYDTKATTTDWGHYKQIVGSVSAYTDTTHYTYPIFVSLTAHHMKKANYILTGLYSLPSLDEYCSWNLTDIFEKQLVYKNRDSFVYVLNTCIFVLADYQPTSFFRQLRDRGNQFFID